MNADIYNSKLGYFKCTVVSDGTMTYAPPDFPPPEVFLFANAPQERIRIMLKESGIEPEKWAAWTSSYSCLFINTGQYRVLVDTGAGNLGADTGRIVPNLKRAGITPEEIDLVIITHAHPDHVGGNMAPDGKPVFPKAKWVMGKSEWQFWTSEAAGQRLPEHSREVLIGIARKNLLPLKDSITLIEGETEIVPGIQAITAPGHTPGQIALGIFSDNERLLYISDVIIHPFHLMEPGWYAAVDVNPEQVAATRDMILTRAADEKALVMAFHLPFPGLGHIVRTGKNWGWQPVALPQSSN